MPAEQAFTYLIPEREQHILPSITLLEVVNVNYFNEYQVHHS